MDQTQPSETASLRCIPQEKLAEIELFPIEILGCGYMVALHRGEGLVEIAKSVLTTHCVLLLIGMSDNRERMSAVVRKYGSLALFGLQRLSSARVCDFQRTLPGGRSYLVDAIDIAGLDVFELMKSTNGLRGPNLGLMEIVCIPREMLISPSEALRTTVDAMTSIAKTSMEQVSGSLAETWQNAINQFVGVTYVKLGATVLKIKNQLTEDQYVLLLAGPAIKPLLHSCENFVGRLDNFIVSP